MSLENQLERLNTNLESLIGAIVAGNGLVSALASPAITIKNEIATSDVADAAAAAAATGDEKSGRGRSKTRYFKNKEGSQAVKTSGVGPGPDWVEITKAEYESQNFTNANNVKSAREAAIDEKLQKAKAEEGADQDPFGTNDAASTKPARTLDDVREIALKLRDATSMDDAKAFIATFGVAKVADLPPAKFDDFVTKAQAKLDALANGGEEL